jgi:hypothetical protein
MSLDKLLNELVSQKLQTQTRRHFLLDCVSKMGGLAIAPLLFGCELGKNGTLNGGLNLSDRDLNLQT